jgi:hypothetical protein
VVRDQVPQAFIAGFERSGGFSPKACAGPARAVSIFAKMKMRSLPATGGMMGRSSARAHEAVNGK